MQNRTPDLDASTPLAAFAGLTDTERIDQAEHAAASLTRVLEAIDAGTIEATEGRRAYLAGIVDALAAITADRA